ncbi:hypothetical protein Cni_G02429 [Canna indica]|uniref:Uncharacterized protein n=1 Tax=Canna indica TaxID=4628 RepID=A0AAQ3Q2B4_9LILI|nr:hypothetical protein Cni_G02429 [Canna indica]
MTTQISYPIIESYEPRFGITCEDEEKMKPDPSINNSTTPPPQLVALEAFYSSRGLSCPFGGELKKGTGENSYIHNNGYDGIPKEIPNPDAKKPEDWDEEEDGE